MRILMSVWMTIAILVIGSNPVRAEDDLFDTGKSDTAVKPFVFPKSMVVIRSCYTPVQPNDANDSVHDLCSSSGQNLTDRHIRKLLVKLDPARIAPARRGKDFKDKVNRTALNSLKKIYDAEFVFLFRQITTKPENGNRITQGLIYLTRQDKLLVVPANSSESPEGLEQLAKDARKVIMSHKYEKRRSNY